MWFRLLRAMAGSWPVRCRNAAGICVCSVAISSCSVLELSSRHGFESGYYRYRTTEQQAVPVYVHITEDTLMVFAQSKDSVHAVPFVVQPLGGNTGFSATQQRFRKQSLDVDLTSVVFKYRPSIAHRPAQLTTDLNAALYTGWRWDTYVLRTKTDPLGNRQLHTSSRGVDAGLFFGAGTAGITPYNTSDAVADEYNGLALQYGIAAFIESSFASFGVSVGWDHLTGPHHKQWIYQGRPWIGFVVGIALQ